METGFMNRIIGLVLALVVGGLLVGGLLIPSIEGMTATEKTFENEGLWRMKEISTGDEWTYDGTTWAYNGESTGIAKLGSNALLGDEWAMRSNGQLRSSNGAGNLSNATVTVTVNDTVQISGSGLQGSGTHAINGYGVDLKGDYIMSDYTNTNMYVNGDTVLYGTGATSITGTNFICHVEGSVNGGATFTIMDAYNSPTITDVVISNAQVNYTPVDGYKDLYQVTSMTCDISCNSTSGGETTACTGTITYSSIVAPYKVTAELSQHLDATQIAMFGVISILGIVALVVVAANGIRNKY